MNNAFKIITSWVEKGNIPETTSYTKLFMSTMQIENNFCNECQYEKQNSRRGGENNVYKTFTSWVEKGNTPNTIPYMELFLPPMKMKKNFCDKHQYEMRKSWNERGDNAYKSFTSWVKERNIPSAISYAEFYLTLMKIKK